MDVIAFQEASKMRCLELCGDNFESNDAYNLTQSFSPSSLFSLHAAMALEIDDGGEQGKEVANLLSCPACADGSHGDHVDANFKIMQLKHGNRGGAHGQPLFKSFAGDLKIEQQGGIECLKGIQMEAFRRFRQEKLGIRAKKTSAAPAADEGGTCSDYRALHESKCSGKGSINGINLGVCRHNVASLEGGACVDTVLIYLFVRCISLCECVMLRFRQERVFNIFIFICGELHISSFYLSPLH
jgi:hypothetical protein